MDDIHQRMAEKIEQLNGRIMCFEIRHIYLSWADFLRWEDACLAAAGGIIGPGATGKYKPGDRNTFLSIPIDPLETVVDGQAAFVDDANEWHYCPIPPPPGFTSRHTRTIHADKPIR